MAERPKTIHQQFFEATPQNAADLYTAYTQYQRDLLRAASGNNGLPSEVRDIVTRSIRHNRGLTYADITQIALALDGGHEGPFSNKWQQMIGASEE